MAVLLFLLAHAHSSQAQTTSAWLNSSNSTWGNSTNWAGGVLPSTTVSALFNGTFTNQPTLGAAQTAQGLWVATGVGQDVTINSATAQTLTITGNSTLNSQTNAGIYMNDATNRNLTIGPNTSITLSNNTGFYNQQSSASTLTISGGLNLNAKTLTIGTGATSTGNITISGNISSSSSGSITINSTGTVSLQGNNTYNGTTTLSAGAVLVGSNTAFGTSILKLGGTLQATIDLSGSNAMVNTLSQSTGDMTFSGSNSITFTGNTNTLSFIGGASRILTNNLSSGKILTFSGNIGINGSAAVRILTIAGSGNTFFSGILSDSSGSGVVVSSPITINSTGVTTFSGNNTYSGTTTLTAGTLNLNASGVGGISSAIGSGNFTITSGTLDNTSGALVTLSTNNAQNWNGNFAFTGTNDLNLGTGNVTMSANRTVTVHGGNLTVGGVIGGAFGLTKNASGNLILSGNNTYTGTTTINAGNLQIGHANALGTSGNITFGGGTLQYGSGLSADLSSRLKNSASAITIDTNANNVTFASPIDSTNAAGLTKSGTGTLTLSGNNTYTGTTTINSGILEISSTGRIGGGTYSGNISNSATFLFGSDSNQTLSGVISGSGALAKNGTSTLTLNGTNTYTGATTINAGTLQVGNGGTMGSLATSSAISNDGTLAFNRSNTITQGTDFASVISGTGSLIKAGSGNLILSGANTYSGATTINAGTLQIGSGSITGSLSTSSAITNNGTLAFNRTDTVTQGTDFASVISGTGALIKAGSGNLILTGNNTYTGTTTISSGTLQLGTGTPGFDGYIASTSMTNNGTVYFNLTGNQTLAYSISGSGNLIKAGNGTLTISPSLNTTNYSGSTWIQQGKLFLFQSYSTPLSRYTIDSGASLDLSNGGGRSLGIGSLVGAGNVVLKGTLTLGTDNTSDANFSGIISGLGGLTKNGTGTQTLFGNNTYTGTTTINAGALNIQQANALGSTTNGTTVASGATLQLQGGISVGAEALTLSGSGSSNAGALRNISGTNSLAGAITLSGATTIGSDAGTLTLSGGISGTQNLTLVGAGNTTLSGSIATSTGTLTKNGSGTATLSAANTYTGATTINSGTLVAAATNALGNSTAVDIYGGSLLVTAGNAINDSAAINLGGGVLAVNGTFDESVGLLTLSSNFVINLDGFSGVLRFGGVGSWGSGANLAIWNWSGTTQYGTQINNYANPSHVVFTDQTGLTGNLGKISFFSGSGTGFIGNAFEQSFSQSGFATSTEIIAVPEPETYLYAVVLLAGIVVQYLRRRAKKNLRNTIVPNSRLALPHRSAILCQGRKAALSDA